MSITALVEDIDNQNESTHKNMGETDEEVQDIDLAFDNNLDLNINNIEIKEDDHVFMATVYLVNPHHFICALSVQMSSGGLCQELKAQGVLGDHADSFAWLCQCLQQDSL
jgi:hypothetical protein